jgi:hypothetical protein
MVNFGLIKTQVSNLLGEHYINNATCTAKSVYKEYIDTVKSSQVLMLEYVVFKNLEQGNMSMEKATKYIDNNIALFKKFDRAEIIKENEKLKRFTTKNSVPDDMVPLYESIQNLILESTRTKGLPNINKIHDSFDYIAESLCKPVKKASLVLESNDTGDGFKFSEIMAIAETKINERYSHLNESEQNILGIILKGSKKAQEDLLEGLKRDAITLLQENQDLEAAEALNVINEMTYNEESFVDNVISLYELVN